MNSLKFNGSAKDGSQMAIETSTSAPEAERPDRQLVCLRQGVTLAVSHASANPAT